MAATLTCRALALGKFVRSHAGRSPALGWAAAADERAVERGGRRRHSRCPTSVPSSPA
jgi:hypothetical protein